MKDLIQFQLSNGFKIAFNYTKFMQRLLFVQGGTNEKATISLKGLKEGETETLETSENYFDVLKKIYPNFDIQKEGEEDNISEN